MTAFAISAQGTPWREGETVVVLDPRSMLTDDGPLSDRSEES